MLIENFLNMLQKIVKEKEDMFHLVVMMKYQ